MNRAEEQTLINAIALRLGTAKQLSERFGIPVPELKAFVQDNYERISKAKERLEGTAEEPADGRALSPQQLDDLWITNKFERLKRLQDVAEATQDMISEGGMSAAELGMAVREFRSYLMLAANELGQLLHRGSGEGASDETLGVSFIGVDVGKLT